MTFVTDPMSLALALGLLGPAAVDEQGLFDEGPTQLTQKEAAEVLANVLQAEVQNDQVVLADAELTETHTVPALVEPSSDL